MSPRHRRCRRRPANAAPPPPPHPTCAGCRLTCSAWCLATSFGLTTTSPPRCPARSSLSPCGAQRCSGRAGQRRMRRARMLVRGTGGGFEHWHLTSHRRCCRSPARCCKPPNIATWAALVTRMVRPCTHPRPRADPWDDLRLRFASDFGFGPEAEKFWEDPEEGCQIYCEHGGYDHTCWGECCGGECWDGGRAKAVIQASGGKGPWWQGGRPAGAALRQCGAAPPCLRALLRAASSAPAATACVVTLFPLRTPHPGLVPQELNSLLCLDADQSEPCHGDDRRCHKGARLAHRRTCRAAATPAHAGAEYMPPAHTCSPLAPLLPPPVPPCRPRAAPPPPRPVPPECV